MGLFSFLGKAIKSDAVPRAMVEIAPANNLTEREIGVSPVAEEHYIRLWVSELFLKNDNKWFSSRFPLAYSIIGLKFGDSEVEIANVSGKNRFEIKQPDLGRSILRNFPLTPLLPFRGGTVELHCGLVSMEANNVLQSFAGVVSDLASKLNVPQVSSVVSIAGSIATGVQDLLGAGKAETMLFVHNGFTADTLRSGYTLLSGLRQTDVDPARIWITKDGVKQGSDATSLKGLDPQDFLVVHIEITQQRDDWRELRAIKDPFDEALAAKANGETEKADTLFKQARVAAIRSADLTRLDKTRIVKGMAEEFAQSFGLPELLATGAVPTESAGLKAASFERALEHVTPEMALNLMPATDDELFQLFVAEG